MKLSELKPCAGCGGPLMINRQDIRINQFFVVDSSMAMLDPKSANQTLGLAQYFQGNLQLAEIMGPAAETAVRVAGDLDPKLKDRVFICFECFYGKPLGLILEAAASRQSKESAA